MEYLNLCRTAGEVQLLLSRPAGVEKTNTKGPQGDISALTCCITLWSERGWYNIILSVSILLNISYTCKSLPRIKTEFLSNSGGYPILSNFENLSRLGQNLPEFSPEVLKKYIY